MITSPDMLRKETVQLMKQIDTQIEAVRGVAQEIGCAPEVVRDGHGAYMMSPLLLAKVMAISTLVDLNQHGRR